MIYFEISPTGSVVQALKISVPTNPTWATNSFDDSVVDAVSALHDPAHWTYASSTWTYTAPTDAQLLAQAVTAQITAIEQSYAQALNGGFTSSASGATLTYASDATALTELGWVRGLTATTYPTTGLEARLADGTFVTLTYTQMQTLINDSQIFFLTLRSQKVALVKQVQTLAATSGTTVAQIQAVVWS